MRTVKHPVLLKDPDVQQFLENTEVLSENIILYHFIELFMWF